MTGLTQSNKDDDMVTRLVTLINILLSIILHTATTPRGMPQLAQTDIGTAFKKRVRWTTFIIIVVNHSYCPHKYNI